MPSANWGCQRGSAGRQALILLSKGTKCWRWTEIKIHFLQIVLLAHSPDGRDILLCNHCVNEDMALLFDIKYYCETEALLMFHSIPGLRGPEVIKLF